MSSIIKRKIKGVTYVYKQTKTYNPETKQSTTKQVLIGKIDPETGETVPTRKKASKTQSHNTEEIKSTSAIVPYRTKAIAEKENPLDPCPERLAVPTAVNYEYSISLHQEGEAFLQKLTMNTDGLQFENGEMRFNGALEPISTVELKNMLTNKGIEDIDIPLLTMYYSIILAKFQERIKQGLDFGTANNMITRIYVPDFIRCLETLSKDSGTNEEKISAIMRKTSAFHNIIGIHYVTRNGKIHRSYFPVMNFEGYDYETNTISFFSPYLNYIVQKIYSASIRRDKKGNPRIKRNGQPMLYPSHSFLVKSSIASERNKTAVENVFIIIQLIEQAGDKGIPHIKAKTIIERNEVLKMRLQNSSNPAQLLRRTFKKTWQLMRTQTLLLNVYEDIELPDPNDITKIPTPSNLNTLIFKFPHKGKTNPKAKAL